MQWQIVHSLKAVAVSKDFFYNNTLSTVPDKYSMPCIFHNINLQLKHVLTHYYDTCSYELTFCPPPQRGTGT